MGQLKKYLLEFCALSLSPMFVIDNYRAYFAGLVQILRRRNMLALQHECWYLGVLRCVNTPCS
jgi:hypothetical protein